MSRILSDENPYYRYSGLAVDGNRKGRGFSTSKTAKGFWEVDLGAVLPVERIDIYPHRGTVVPLDVSVSKDKEKYIPISTIKSFQKQNSMSIAVSKESRYIKIESKKKGSLSLIEVEVYSTKSPKPVLRN